MISGKMDSLLKNTGTNKDAIKANDDKRNNLETLMKHAEAKNSVLEKSIEELKNDRYVLLGLLKIHNTNQINSDKLIHDNQKKQNELVSQLSDYDKKIYDLKMLTVDKQDQLTKSLATNKHAIKKIDDITQRNENNHSELVKKVEDRDQTQTTLSNLVHQRQTEDEMESERIKCETAKLKKLLMLNNDKQELLKNILIQNSDKNSMLSDSLLANDLKQTYMKNILLDMVSVNKQFDNKLNKNVDNVSKLAQQNLDHHEQIQNHQNKIDLTKFKLNEQNEWNRMMHSQT